MEVLQKKSLHGQQLIETIQKLLQMLRMPSPGYAELQWEELIDEWETNSKS